VVHSKDVTRAEICGDVPDADGNFTIGVGAIVMLR